MSHIKRRFWFGKSKEKVRDPVKKSPTVLQPQPEVAPQPPRPLSPPTPPVAPAPQLAPPQPTLATLARNDDYGCDLSSYVLGNALGKGQFSEVFQATFIRTGEKVALKKISIFEMLDAKARADCMKEINLLQQLDHPNVIKHLTSFTDHNDLYIVLELADGGDMAKLIKYFRRNKQLMKEALIWRYFQQICAALEHMHSKRVMHRDIKPANVFMTAKVNC